MSAQKAKRKKANGFGTIRKRKEGQWEARYTAGTDLLTGKQIQRSVYGKSKPEVEKKLSEALAAMAQSQDKEKALSVQFGLSFGAWLDSWIRNYCITRKPNTVDQYEYQIRINIKPALGEVPLSELNGEQIQQLYNRLMLPHKVVSRNGRLMKSKGLSPKSIKNVHGVIHESLSKAVKLHYISENPSESCELPKTLKFEIQPIPSEKIGLFLEEIQADEYAALLFVTLFTGMRQGEIMGLCWACVDFDRELLTVKYQLQRERKKGGQYKLVTLKNDRVRVIKPASFVFNELHKIKAVQEYQQKLCKGEWQNRYGLVFTDSVGNSCKKSTVYNHFKRICRKLGYPKIRFHDLRHTFATISLQNHDNVKTVSQNLGHATVAFTLDIYGHVSDEMRRESAAKMQKFYDSIQQDT